MTTIKKKFGVEYHVRSVWDLVLRLGFTHMKPRPRDRRGASRQKIAAFKKKARADIAHYAGLGFTPVSADEMYMSMKSIIGNGWYRRRGSRGEDRSKQIAAAVTGRRSGRTAMIGAIGDGGLCHFEFHDAGNTKNVESFFLQAHSKLGNLLVYTDNASYHGQKMFDRLYEATGGGIVVRYLPEYTPELAPIETQWREIKRYVANLFFDDIDQMEDAVMDGLRSGLIKIVKVHDYMIV